MASYYGSTPTANSFNMASGTITNGGTGLTLGARATTNFRTLQYRAVSYIVSAADNASAGWYGTASSNTVYIGQGFRIVYSFSFEDTTSSSTNPCRSYIGLMQNSTDPVLTTTLQALTIQSCVIMHETFENVFYFYTRGSSGATPTATTISSATPSALWYVLEIVNQQSSNDVTMTLTAYTSMTSYSVATFTFTGGTSTTPSLTAANNVVMLRYMNSPTNTSQARVGLGAIKIYTL